MISKETFIKTIERLEDLSNRMDVADRAMRGLCEDFGSFYICDAFNARIKANHEYHYF